VPRAAAAGAAATTAAAMVATQGGAPSAVEEARAVAANAASPATGHSGAAARPASIYSAEDKEGDPRFKGFLDAPVKTKTITR
jgi:hypothetical protein